MLNIAFGSVSGLASLARAPKKRTFIQTGTQFAKRESRFLCHCRPKGCVFDRVFEVFQLFIIVVKKIQHPIFPPFSVVNPSQRRNIGSRSAPFAGSRSPPVETLSHVNVSARQSGSLGPSGLPRSRKQSLSAVGSGGDSIGTVIAAKRVATVNQEGAGT